MVIALSGKYHYAAVLENLNKVRKLLFYLRKKATSHKGQKIENLSWPQTNNRVFNKKTHINLTLSVTILLTSQRNCILRDNACFEPSEAYFACLGFGQPLITDNYFIAVGEVSEYCELFRLVKRLWIGDMKTRCFVLVSILEIYRIHCQ